MNDRLALITETPRKSKRTGLVIGGIIALVALLAGGLSADGCSTIKRGRRVEKKAAMLVFAAGGHSMHSRRIELLQFLAGSSPWAQFQRRIGQ
jgi:hypothetical protein